MAVPSARWPQAAVSSWRRTRDKVSQRLYRASFMSLSTYQSWRNISYYRILESSPWKCRKTFLIFYLNFIPYLILGWSLAIPSPSAHFSDLRITTHSQIVLPWCPLQFLLLLMWGVVNWVDQCTPKNQNMSTFENFRSNWENVDLTKIICD